MKRNWNFLRGFKIYFNLHKKCFSILAWDLDKKGWRLYSHEDSIEVSNAKMKISEIGRQRVIKEKRKNVHAFVYAEKIKTTCPTAKIKYNNRCSYNPYKHGFFYDALTEKPIMKLDKALMHSAGILY